MHYAKVTKSKAETLKCLLVKEKLLDHKRKAKHGSRYVYFPLIDARTKTKKLIGSSAKLVNRKDDGTKGHLTYSELLEGALSKDELKLLARGYDAFGSIAIIEIPDELQPKARAIAGAILKSNKHIKTVFAKAGAVSGLYRIRRVRYIAGEKTSMAHHVENGCTFVFDIRKTFFSPRLSYERNRICKLAKSSENIAVPFAGVGPFAIEIGKTHPNSNIIAIELNRQAYNYMVKNISINKTRNVVPICGDFSRIAKEHRDWADRIVMPSPTTTMNFLGSVIQMAKKSATVHMYVFCDAKNGINKKQEEITKFMKKNGYKTSFLFSRIVRTYSKNEIEAAIDFTISKI